MFTLLFFYEKQYSASNGNSKGKKTANEYFTLIETRLTLNQTAIHNI